MDRYKQVLILRAIGFVGILIFIFFSFNEDVDLAIDSIAFLPLGYGCCTLFYSLTNVKTFRTIILCCFSITYLLLPATVCFYGKFDLGGYNHNLVNYIPDAVFMQILEIISVTVFLILYKCNDDVNNHKLRISLSLSKRTARLLVSIFFVSIFLIILYPQLLLKFQTIIYNDYEDFVIHQNLAATVKASTPMVVYHLGFWLITISKLLIVYYIIVRIYNNGKSQSWFRVIISIAIIFISCLFTTDDKAATVYSAVIAFFLLHKLYTTKSKGILRFLFVGGGICILYIFIIAPILSKHNVAGVLMYKLNAYFAGTFNVSASFLMEVSDPIKYLLGDILRNVPVLKGFFTSMPMSYIEFNRALGYDSIYNSQILPVIGQGYFYFGIWGSILFPLLMLYFSINLYKRWQRVNDSFMYYALGVNLIYLLLGLYLYDMFLTFGLMLQYGLPIFAIASISNKHKYEKNIVIH